MAVWVAMFLLGRWLDKFEDSPCNQRIGFLSQKSTAEVVEEALGTGACGYLVKARAASQ